MLTDYVIFRALSKTFSHRPFILSHDWTTIFRDNKVQITAAHTRASHVGIVLIMQDKRVFVMSWLNEFQHFWYHIVDTCFKKFIYIYIYFLKCIQPEDYWIWLKGNYCWRWYIQWNGCVCVCLCTVCGVCVCMFMCVRIGSMYITNRNQFFHFMSITIWTFGVLPVKLKKYIFYNAVSGKFQPIISKLMNFG